MKPHEYPRIRKKSIRGDSGDSWPVWNRGILHVKGEKNFSLGRIFFFSFLFFLLFFCKELQIIFY